MTSHLWNFTDNLIYIYIYMTLFLRAFVNAFRIHAKTNELPEMGANKIVTFSEV